VLDPLRAIGPLNSVDVVVVGGWATLQHGATRLPQGIDVPHEVPTRDGTGVDGAFLRAAAATTTDDGRTFTMAASPRAAGRRKDREALPELAQTLADASTSQRPHDPPRRVADETRPAARSRRSLSAAIPPPPTTGREP
jgi:hypothetical protein